MFLVLALSGIGKLRRRVMLALAQPMPPSNRKVPPEFFKFPFC